jgi:hypothetical protein
MRTTPVSATDNSTDSPFSRSEATYRRNAPLMALSSALLHSISGRMKNSFGTPPTLGEKWQIVLLSLPIHLHKLQVLHPQKLNPLAHRHVPFAHLVSSLPFALCCPHDLPSYDPFVVDWSCPPNSI